MSEPAPDAELLQRLDVLEAESRARRAELQAIAAELPAVVSRRALARSVASDLWHAPNKGEIAGRGLRKLLRAPGAVWRRMTGRHGVA